MSFTFPDYAKVGTGFTTDNKTDDNKYVEPNCKPVTLLNGFSKIYKNI